ncbi:hypothetical protein GCM10009123_22400 [Kangiella japonica]|uniref:Uncharacterized protein n=1 Tax=Kangiella japonica TaxID=647384 RepID=A0ABP3CT82_9GAMM
MFRAQAGDPVHYIGGGNGTFWQRVKSLRNTFALFGDATVSPHTLPCKKSRTATCD